MPQEPQGECTEQATSQLYGVRANPAKLHWDVNHISTDEAQEKPEVVIGMFSVNDIPAVILFHSGASHAFIS